MPPSESLPDHGATGEREWIASVCSGNPAAFEPLVLKYQPKVFATVRKYARRESEVEDIVQEIFLKAFRKLNTFRGDSPFEHWLMRLAVRTCYDFLRDHQRNREHNFAEFTPEQAALFEKVSEPIIGDPNAAAAAHDLVHKVLEQLPPAARLIITLMDIEERSMKEVAALTGWSIPVIKIRAFRARQALKAALTKLDTSKYV